MKFECTEVFNVEGALRGMRNPYDSHNKSDSVFCNPNGCNYCEHEKCENNDWYEDDFSIGKNDLDLMHRLVKAGTEHRKFLRQIVVSVDITAPRYWWTEFDTYKVGVTRNSCSTMHKLASTPITYDSFEHKDLVLVGLPETLESIRTQYQNTKNYGFFMQLKANLPESFLQKSTVTMNYEVILTMYRQRKNHRLTEWSKDFIEWCDELPYFKDIADVS